MERIDKATAFNPKKPKVSLRRFTDPWDRLAIKQYILNRHSESGPFALENVYRVLRRGK